MKNLIVTNNESLQQIEKEINIFESLNKNKTELNVNISYELKVKLSKCNSKSQMIRLLNKERYNNKSISKILNIRYQFVYNVLNQKVK